MKYEDAVEMSDRLQLWRRFWLAPVCALLGHRPRGPDTPESWGAYWCSRCHDLVWDRYGS